ncbi:unnamed protein product [Protopolystoma xenopodis]|uniref:Uncharacterized protein n=1 Tax=Protopolystoma xenopodis TaxID=117903 RepID=A0A3S5FG55_9PLAT|nr:unnamed protein product [Protopolystoma xenopodis]
MTHHPNPFLAKAHCFDVTLPVALVTLCCIAICHFLTVFPCLPHTSCPQTGLGASVAHISIVQTTCPPPIFTLSFDEVLVKFCPTFASLGLAPLYGFPDTFRCQSSWRGITTSSESAPDASPVQFGTPGLNPPDSDIGPTALTVSALGNHYIQWLVTLPSKFRFPRGWRQVASEVARLPVSLHAHVIKERRESGTPSSSTSTSRSDYTHIHTHIHICHESRSWGPTCTILAIWAFYPASRPCLNDIAQLEQNDQER